MSALNISRIIQKTHTYLLPTVISLSFFPISKDWNNINELHISIIILCALLWFFILSHSLIFFIEWKNNKLITTANKVLTTCTFCNKNKTLVTLSLTVTFESNEIIVKNVNLCEDCEDKITDINFNKTPLLDCSSLHGNTLYDKNNTIACVIEQIKLLINRN